MGTALISVAVILLVSGLMDTSPRCVFGSPAEKVSKNENPKCGLSTLVLPVDKRITSEGDFPWHASIYQKRSEKWESVCGGTLITPRIVLTSAVCVTQFNHGGRSKILAPEELKVALGKLNRSWDTKEKNQVTPNVSQIQVHPNFVGQATSYAFNLALLTLDAEVPISNFIMPACLDLTSEHEKQFNEDKTLKGYFTGFGSREECREIICDPKEQLNHMETNILDYNTCLDALLAVKKLPYVRLPHDHFCVGNGTTSFVERGDNGGGLTLVFDGLHYVFGVISTKLKLEISNELHSYGTLTSVPSNIAWLKSQLG